MKKITGILMAIIFLTGSFLFSEGKHIGEVKGLDVSIDFYSPSGKTITNEKGIFYNFWGYTFHENKIYPEKYWGEFPLYFFGQLVPIKVKVTNKGPRAKVKMQVIVEAYCLNTDGSSGVALTKPKVINFEVKKGETRIIDASFVADYVEGAESGLDRFVVKVLHQNEGKSGKVIPALIMTKEGIFCPPEYQP